MVVAEHGAATSATALDDQATTSRAQRATLRDVGDELRDDHLERPSDRRLSPTHPWRAEILERHAGAVAERRPTYRDPTSGLAVFTAAFLADRGTCCDSGCRHCPYVGGGPGGS